MNKLFSIHRLTARILAALSAAALIALLLTPVGRAPAASVPGSTLPRGTLLTLTTRYALCEHSRTAREALVCPGECTDIAGLQALYPGWQVTAFSDEGASLARTLSMPCELHYLISLSGARISLSRLTDGVPAELGSAEIAPDALDPELVARLLRGVTADSLSEAEAIIESLCS